MQASYELGTGCCCPLSRDYFSVWITLLTFSIMHSQSVSRYLTSYVRNRQKLGQHLPIAKALGHAELPGTFRIRRSGDAPDCSIFR